MTRSAGRILRSFATGIRLAMNSKQPMIANYAIIKSVALLTLILALWSCANPQTSDPVSANKSETGTLRIKQSARSHPSISKTHRSKPEINSTESTPSHSDSSDVWIRIGENLALTDAVTDDQVNKQLKRFTNNQRYFDRTFARAELYLPYVVNRVLEENLPAEIALIPFVESAYNPFARSHSGAEGLWQFIPSTGDHLDLERNSWYDGRRDIISSTDAAIGYLGTLNEKFDEDWLLALTAYNAGPGTVQNAINVNTGEGKDGDFWSLHLRGEASKYVPKLIALSKIVADPEKYGIELPPISSEPNLSVVSLAEPIDLNLAARLADISTDTIYQLNPGYKKWITPPEGSYHLVLPGDIGVREFEHKLANTQPSTTNHWHPRNSHVVASGDTLSKIAHQSGLTTKELALMNNIRTNDVLRIGQVLQVAGNPAGDAQTVGTTHSVYKVKAGDNLWDIAKKNSVTIDDLLTWNNLSKTSTLRPGQIIKLSSKS